MSAATFSAEEKYELMTRNLQEVLGGDKIKAILAKGETVKCYWGKYMFMPNSNLSCNPQFVALNQADLDLPPLVPHAPVLGTTGTAPTGRRESRGRRQ
jgi:hypothetical protein